MPKADKCSKCGSTKQTEIISGGITMKVFRDGEQDIRDEITYQEKDKYSRWECSDCGAEWV